MNIERLLLLAQNKKSFQKNEYIFHAGDVIQSFGIVLSGSVQIEQNDFWGNRTILDKISDKEFFAETYAITEEPMMVDVMCVEDAEIAFINVQKIFTEGKDKEKEFLTGFLLRISSRKNLNLSRKIMFTSPKAIRPRILAYLTYESKIIKNKEFDIPFDRQQLADYLNVDRSALSSELSKMQKAGLIEAKKNHFVLKPKGLNL